MGELINLPKYILEIKQRKTPCLGDELSEIVICIKSYSQAGVWYASDVDTSGDNLKIKHLMSPHSQKVGSPNELIKLAQSIGQFLSGVFLLIPVDIGPKLASRHTTDSSPFSDLGKAILEIRAFDTTSYEIYSNNLNILEALSKKFNTPIKNKQECLKAWGTV